MNKYRISIRGKNKESFLKFLISRKINLYNIILTKEELKITIDEKDYSKVLKYKGLHEVKILNTYGTLKIKYLLDKYRYILFSFLLVSIIKIFLSNLVFKIEVIHQKEEIKEIIYNVLYEFGLRKYRPKITYKQKENLKEKILEKEKDKIEWIEIDNIGTKYIIHVEERKIKKEKIDNRKRDIVAKKEAMILEIKATTGEILKKKYDHVQKGETIISGTIKNKDKEVAKVKAEGKVYGEVWYNVDVTLPTNYHEERRIGKVKRDLSLRIVNKNINFPPSKNKSFEKEDIVLLNNQLLPIKLVLEKKYELKIIDKKYTIENSSREAIKIAEEKLLKQLDDDSTILYKKVLKKTINNSTIIVDVFFKVKENITDYTLISDELKEGGENEEHAR